MDTKALLIALGIALVLMPSAFGYRYFREWFSENHRLDRRIKQVEKDARYF